MKRPYARHRKFAAGLTLVLMETAGCGTKGSATYGTTKPLSAIKVALVPEAPTRT